MPTITTSDGVEIFFKDWGSGQPIVFSHGWPLSSDDWDAQLMFFLGQGYRVVAHDRRGHGRSGQVADGHDMDHYADDLAAVVNHLDLRDAVHVGHQVFGAVGITLEGPAFPLSRRIRQLASSPPGADTARSVLLADLGLAPLGAGEGGCP